MSRCCPTNPTICRHRANPPDGKTRYLPLHPGTHALIHDYLEAVGHAGDEAGALFRRWA